VQSPQAVVGESVSAQLLQELIERECGAWRERLYPPLTTLGLFVGQTLSSDGACQDAVARYLSERTGRGEGPCSLNTGPYCRARARLPVNLVLGLQRAVGARLEQALPERWGWCGRAVKLVDGTTVSMPDTPANQAVYPQHRGQRPGLGFPLARLVGLLGLGSGAVLDWAMGPYEGQGSGELGLFYRLMDTLEAGDVALADRYFANYWIVALLQARGVDCLMRAHAHRRCDFRRGQRLGRGDHIVYWQRPKQRPAWLDEATCANLPERIAVREIAIGGRVLVSTLTDAKAFSPQALDELYRLRWRIELDLRTIKDEMGMELLRCKDPQMVQKEVAVYLLAYNLVRAAMAQAAVLADVLPRALSFKGAVQVLGAFHEQLRHCGRARTSIMIGCVLGAIAQMRIPHRPGRVEPRAVKRRPKPHRLLMEPRPIARARLLAPVREPACLR